MIVVDERDTDVIRRMLMYCDEVDEAVVRFGKSLEHFVNNVVFRNSVSMSIMQIGELTKRLSDEFITSHSEIQWQKIRGMRNWFAHSYHEMDVEAIWRTVVEDIPAFRNFCEDILN